MFDPPLDSDVRRLIWLRAAAPALANRRVCGGCGGRRSNREEVAYFERCNRCGGSGQKRSGKVSVPCSGCGGAGGKNKTRPIMVTCRRCGGTGFQ